MSNLKIKQPQRNYAEIQKQVETFIKEQIENTKTKGVVFGLSGGLDSSVVAYLCKKALDDNYPMLAVLMPDNTIQSNALEMQDAMTVIKNLGIQHETIQIDPLVAKYQEQVEYQKLQGKLVLGNLRARIRSNIIYNFANMFQYLVMGTSDKSELHIGYFTKYGDGACDVMPIAHLYKTEVRELAKHLKVPAQIVEKKSSPHLWTDQTAENEIGASYEEVDAVLHCVVDQGLRTHDNIKKQLSNIEPAKIDRILDLYIKSEHKRHMPPSLHV